MKRTFFPNEKKKRVVWVRGGSRRVNRNMIYTISGFSILIFIDSTSNPSLEIFFFFFIRWKKTTGIKRKRNGEKYKETP